MTNSLKMIDFAVLIHSVCLFVCLLSPFQTQSVAKFLVELRRVSLSPMTAILHDSILSFSILVHSSVFSDWEFIDICG